MNLPVTEDVSMVPFVRINGFLEMKNTELI